MPSTQLQNAAQVWGVSSLAGYTGDDRWALVNEFRAATTITRGDIVALSTSTGYVIDCLTNTGQQLMVGIAAATASSGTVVPVVIYGPFFGAKKDNTVAVTAADLVTRSAAVTAGVLSLAGSTAVTTLADTGKTIGIVMASQTAGDTTADIFVCKI